MKVAMAENYCYLASAYHLSRPLTFLSRNSGLLFPKNAVTVNDLFVFDNVSTCNANDVTCKCAQGVILDNSAL